MEDKEIAAGGQSELQTSGEEGEEAPQKALPVEEIKIDLQGEIERLKDALEEKTREASAHYDRFLRAVADLENYKKRVEKEREELLNFANERLIKELLPTLDNLERALLHMNEETNLTTLKEGVEFIRGQILSTLKKFGLEEVHALGERFDPTKHEAITQEESEGYEPGVVIKEFQKGYYLRDRLIRPAMVSVSKAPEKVKEVGDEQQYKSSGGC